MRSSLTWAASPASDFAFFRLHRGSDYVFVPAPENMVAELTGTSYDDAAGNPYIYKLVAVDVHGNPSPSALFVPHALDAPAPRAIAALTLESPWPHPLHGNAVFRFALAREGPASLALFDVAGRRVATLFEGVAGAGLREIPWSADRAGVRLANGVYVLRLESAGETRTRRVVIAR